MPAPSQQLNKTESHHCTLTGNTGSVLQPNYFTVREPQVALGDVRLLVIHRLVMTLVVAREPLLNFTP